MSVQNGERLATKQDLADLYNGILPYLGGSVNAGFTPIGTIIAVFAETAPINYLACDGSTYNKSDYPELASHLLALTDHSAYEVSGDNTKFKVPDLRGEFLRGTGTNSHTDQGSGANVGVHQDATIFPEVSNDAGSLNLYSPKPILSGTRNNNSDSNPSKWADNTAKEGRVRVRDGNYNKYDDYVAGSGGGLITSRPTNTSVLYCIATKNFYIDPTLDYSTEEKIIGTWLNGEPLYQKTVSCGGLVNNAEKTVAHGISNLDKYMVVGGYAGNSIGGSRPVPYVSSNGTGIGLDVDTTNIYIDCGGNWSVFTESYITLQYTKSNS